MLNLIEKKLIAYTSIVVALLLNVFKLFSLRQNAIIPHVWTFNTYEFIFQVIWNLLFCLSIGWITVATGKRKTKTFYVLLLYLLALFVAQPIGVAVQKNIFNNDTPYKIFRAVYFFRLTCSLIFEAILIRLFWLLQERKVKDKETEQLRNAYLTAQLELLKQQLNPHFFFNALTNLSAIVREDSKKAQQYIVHLSKIFRYTLDAKDRSLVRLEEEISILNSYIELMKMRLEENVKIDINIDGTCFKKQLPHMSLQPLLENAVKHNSVSKAKPLYISIQCSNEKIIISNNLQPVITSQESTGIGLLNLNERFKILTGKEINISQVDEAFTVTLPISMSLRIVIIEDEPAIARNLSYLISEIQEDANILIMLESIKESVEWFSNNNNYDLILSDIRLSDGLSFEIFQRVTINVPVIFITAYDEYALDAFKANGIDYILKPFDEDALKNALNKFKNFGSKNIFSQTDILKLLQNIKPEAQLHKQSLLVHYRDKLVPVNISDISFFYSKNEIVHAYLQHIQYLIDGTLEQLGQQLDPSRFFRANRQFIVNRKAITEAHFYFNGRLLLKINPEPSEKVLISKARVPEFKEWMNK